MEYPWRPRLQSLRDTYVAPWGPPIPPPPSMRKGKQRAPSPSSSSEGDGKAAPRITVIEAPTSPPRPSTTRCPVCSSSPSRTRAPLFEDDDVFDEDPGSPQEERPSPAFSPAKHLSPLAAPYRSTFAPPRRVSVDSSVSSLPDEPWTSSPSSLGTKATSLCASDARRKSGSSYPHSSSLWGSIGCRSCGWSEGVVEDEEGPPIAPSASRRGPVRRKSSVATFDPVRLVDPDPLSFEPLPPLSTFIPPSPSRTTAPRPSPIGPGKKESLLTKSLRQLGGRLPNLQWGSSPDVALPVVSPRSSSTDGRRPINVADFVAATSSPRPGDLDTGLPWEAGSGEGWGTGFAFGGNSKDPELEWSSMMVQLDTFARPSSPAVGIPPTTSPPRHAQSVRSGSGPRRRRSRSSLVLSTSPPRPSPTLTRSSSSPLLLAPTSFDGRAETRRLLANPYHLLQLTLELEMMRGRKIRAPLRQRAVKVVAIVPRPADDVHVHSGEGDAILVVDGRGRDEGEAVGAFGSRPKRERRESGLRWELGVE